MPSVSGFAELIKKARGVHQTAPRFPLFPRNERCPHRPVRIAPVGVGDCPPSCHPIPACCRSRQSGHFLEIASLLPPLAALRRFPRRPAHRTPLKTCHCEPARTSVWQTVIPLRRTSDTWENGFPRRFAPRNDIFTKIILFCVGRGSTPPACVLLSGERGGAEPPPLRMFCKFLCRAAPMCAAADMHRISIPCVGVGVPDDPFHRTPQKMSLRTGAHAGVANRLLFSPFHPKKQTPNYAKHKNPKTPCEEGYTMLK